MSAWVVFFGANTIVGNVVRAQPDWRWLSIISSRSAPSAFNNATRYWTMTELNASHPALAGPLLANRLIWFGVALAALGFAYWRFSFSERGVSARRLRRQQRRDAKLAAAPVAMTETLPAARPGSATWARLVARTRLEMAMVFRSPAFSILMLIGLLLAGVIMYFSARSMD